MSTLAQSEPNTTRAKRRPVAMCWVGPLLAIFLCHTGCVAPWTIRAPVVIETSQSFLKFPLGIYSIQSVYTQLVRVTVRGGTHIQHRTKLCTVLNGTDHTIGPDTQAVPTNVEKDETSHLSSTEPQVLIPAPLQTFLGWSHFVNKGNAQRVTIQFKNSSSKT